MQVINKFNRGEVDENALVREDIPRITDSCALMENWLPEVLGSMSFRTGTEFIGEAANFDTGINTIPFIYSVDDTADIQFTNSTMRVWVGDEKVTREDFSPAPSFSIASWSDISDTGAVTSTTATEVLLKGGDSLESLAKMTQDVNINSPLVEHGVTIVVKYAPVTINLDGSIQTLSAGTHKLAFTPSGSTITVTLENSRNILSSAQITFDMPNDIMTFDVDIPNLKSLRYAQSADVVYFTHLDGMFIVERRGKKSWSLVDFQSENGPFGKINNTANTLKVSALSGDVTLTSTKDLFTPDSVNTLYKLGSRGQSVKSLITTDNQSTNSIRVTGVGDGRKFSVNLTGTFSATVTLEQSDDDSTWIDYKTYTTSGTSTSIKDELDNSITYYRLTVKSGDYTSGTVDARLSFSGGSIEGICRVREYIDTKNVIAQTLEDFGSTESTRDWYEGEWSVKKGYPNTVDLHSGRLFFAGKSKIWGSVSDAFKNFDSSIEGDSQAIQKTIGFGPIDKPNWLGSTDRLLIGIPTDEITMRSDSFGSILTQNNSTISSSGTLGSADADAVKLDDSILFAQRGLRKLIRISHDYQSDSYGSEDLTLLHPDLCFPGIKKIAIARCPETRIYVVLENGELRILLFDATENVKGWSRFKTYGLVRDVLVTPTRGDDVVKIVVLRGDIGFETLDYEKISTVNSGNYVDSLGRHDIPYTAKYKSGRMGIVAKNSVLTERVRILSMGIIAKDQAREIRYGYDFDNLRSMAEVFKGKDTPLDDPMDNYEHVKFDFAGKIEADSRICIEATKPCTIQALTYEIEEAKQPQQ